MSEDLVLSILEIEKNKQPDWDKAREALVSQTEEQLVQAWMTALMIDDPEDHGGTPEDIREVFQKAIQDCEDGWKGMHNKMYSFELSSLQILIGGDTTWGDPVEVCESISLFCSCGAAKAAGFING